MFPDVFEASILSPEHLAAIILGTEYTKAAVHTLLVPGQVADPEDP